MAKTNFCIATARPPKCRLTTNICCVFCKFHEDCVEKHKGLTPKPCAKDYNTYEEKCEFSA